MMTPEPMALPLCVVTLTSTTPALSFAMAASCAVCAAAVVCVVEVAALLALPAVAVVLLNCQPAKSPVPKMRSSTSANAPMAQARKPPPLLRLAGGSSGVGGVGNVGSVEGCCG